MPGRIDYDGVSAVAVVGGRALQPSPRLDRVEHSGIDRVGCADP
jgi:hypothetical protein